MLLLVVAGAAGLLLAWLVVKQGVAAGGSFRSPAAMIASDHPTIVLRSAAAEFAAKGGSISERSYSLAMDALRDEPLAAEPFFLAAARRRSDDVGALGLLEEARRRNPRLRPARLILVDRYLRSGRFADASDEIAALARLMPTARDLLVQQLAGLAAQPDMTDAVGRALAGDALLDLVLEQLARQGADARTVTKLAAGSTHRDGGAPQWQALLVASLVRKGDTRQGFRLWRRYSGAEGRAESLIYDPDFKGMPGPAPFNWSFTENETGTAEVGRDGRLMVDYFGRNSGELVSQLLLLEPGRYRLRIQAEGNATGEGSRLAWRVVCHGSSRALFELPLADITSVPRNLTGEFDVPSTDCGAQWLRLEGISAEFPTTQSVEIQGLRLQRIGRSS